jgi:hypothetical protein
MKKGQMDGRMDGWTDRRTSVADALTSFLALGRTNITDTLTSGTHLRHI